MKEENDKRPEMPEPRPNHVKIVINGKELEVHPGNHPVAELKNRGGVPKEDTLCMMVDGEVKPLSDKDHVEIMGGEVFASNCPSGGAS